LVSLCQAEPIRIQRLVKAGYRYGFNGKEKDPSGEWGSEAIYDYGFRIYNPSIAKFLSVDPLTASYPWYTPYQFAGNKPIFAIDLDGLEEQIAIDGTVLLDTCSGFCTAEVSFSLRKSGKVIPKGSSLPNKDIVQIKTLNGNGG